MLSPRTFAEWLRVAAQLTFIGAINLWLALIRWPLDLSPVWIAPGLLLAGAIFIIVRRGLLLRAQRSSEWTAADWAALAANQVGGLGTVVTLIASIATRR